jgi:hypothetical protein
MVGILSVNVKDGSEIAIDTGRRRRGRSNFHPFDTLRMNRFKMRDFKTLNGGSGGEESGNSKEGEDTHIFILRGLMRLAGV